MQCPTTANPNHHTPPTANRPAASVQTASSPHPSALNPTASRPAPGSALAAVPNNTPAAGSITESNLSIALHALNAILEDGSSLHYSLSNTHLTRADAARWVAVAGEIHRHAETAIVALVDILTTLIRTPHTTDPTLFDGRPENK